MSPKETCEVVYRIQRAQDVAQCCDFVNTIKYSSLR